MAGRVESDINQEALTLALNVGSRKIKPDAIRSKMRRVIILAHSH